MRAFRVLILTAGFGDGHNAAARGVEEALHRVANDGGAGVGAEVAVRDIFDATHPRASTVLKRGYRFAIVSAPRVWKALYHLSDRMSFENDALGLFGKITRRLKAMIEDFRPQAVVVTYPLYPQLLERIAGRHGRLPCPVFTVITDAVSINQTWLKGRSDRFLVCDEESRDVLLASGVAAERVVVTGFPVHPAHADLLGNGQPDDRWSPPARVLYFPSTPARHVDRTLAALADMTADSDLRLTVATGRHARRLRGTLDRWRGRFGDGRLRVIGWSDAVPRLLRDHHVIVGKAGGALVHEAMAARRPLIVDSIVPGQEEGNARQLVAAGCGMIADSPHDVAAALRGLFADDGRAWRAMVARAAEVSRPDAAADVARLVLASAEFPPHCP